MIKFMVSILIVLWMQGCGGSSSEGGGDISPSITTTTTTSSLEDRGETSTLDEDQNSETSSQNSIPSSENQGDIKSDEVIISEPVVSTRVLNLSAKIVEQDVQLSWFQQNGIDHYLLTIEEDNEEIHNIILDKEETNYIDYAVETATRYMYRLEALDIENSVVVRDEIEVLITPQTHLQSDEATI